LTVGNLDVGFGMLCCTIILQCSIQT
jgi:hypothetical protein